MAVVAVVLVLLVARLALVALVAVETELQVTLQVAQDHQILAVAVVEQVKQAVVLPRLVAMAVLA
jgi:hypothetical protein